MQFLPRFVPCAKNIDVDAKEEEEAAQEEVDVEELVVALRNIDRDDLSQGQR